MYSSHQVVSTRSHCQLESVGLEILIQKKKMENDHNIVTHDKQQLNSE